MSERKGILASFREQQDRLETREREAKSTEIASSALSEAREANRIALEQLSIAKLAAIAAEEQAKAAFLQARWARWAAIIATTAALIIAHESIISSIYIILSYL